MVGGATADESWGPAAKGNRTLHRLPIDSRWEIAEALLSHADDSEDPNLPLIIWHGIEPAIAKDRTKAVQLLAKCKIQKVRQFITRRMTAP
jgi:hypothetical protein